MSKCPFLLTLHLQTKSVFPGLSPARNSQKFLLAQWRQLLLIWRTYPQSMFAEVYAKKHLRKLLDASFPITALLTSSSA